VFAADALGGGEELEDHLQGAGEGGGDGALVGGCGEGLALGLEAGVGEGGGEGSGLGGEGFGLEGSREMSLVVSGAGLRVRGMRGRGAPDWRE